jgi:hypothetical protein
MSTFFVGHIIPTVFVGHLSQVTGMNVINDDIAKVFGI